ncbi:hypothetical protein DB32_000554 [Sandaracinus amylolyticus]|uniref:Uncharacterized protein n=1 Tax=Sandaracinus amylolyticus TaxID=927083 RepID=A0A0F6VZ90_9BACT|nr:hypothetical protein DB32_000554 [Sandaracinus amylolyticus]
MSIMSIGVPLAKAPSKADRETENTCEEKSAADPPAIA